MSDAQKPPLVLDKLPVAGTTDADTVLNAFLDVVGHKGLSLYEAQENALLELLAGKHVVLSTPTGSGKSLVALGLHFKAMSEGVRSVYTAPIKALVSEKFFSLCEDFGAAYVGMMTGDASINRDAPILCCTAEILMNLALTQNSSTAPSQKIAAVVMDEFHYYGDKERGMAWQAPLLTMPDTQFLLMSGTLGDMSGIMQSLERETGRPAVEVTSSVRPVPLDFEYVETPIHETIETLVSSNRAPVYIVHFTQREAAEQAQALLSTTIASKDDKAKIAEILREARFDTPYGKEVKKFLAAGIGIHHAGLLPKYRLLVEQLAQEGLLKVICGTDTLGVGVNIPIRTVLFTKLSKFDGENTGILPVRDFLQIAGRAGRKGFDDRGWVVVQAPEHIIENKRAEAKFAAGESKKKPQKKSPEPGFVAWDQGTFTRLTTRPPEPLVSRFQITHGILLQLLQQENGHGYRRLVELVGKCHETDTNKTKHLVRAAQLFRALREAALVRVEKVERRGDDGVEQRSRVFVKDGLQIDFSLHQTLSLYLVETIDFIDPASETWPLDVVTVVESILENPKAILMRQEDKEKTLAIAEMKAAGMEYEERMAELEKITWPKPGEEFLYETFNEFKKKHPWVGENVRPKSIARDMLERYMTFNEYIKEYGLERSEGLLLRSLSDFYKTLSQTVPEEKKTEPLQEIEAWFRSLIARVDASLVEEWESLANAGRRVVKASDNEPVMPIVAVAIDDNPRAFKMRVRAELHLLIKALAQGDYEEAVSHVEGVDVAAAKAAADAFAKEKGHPVRFTVEARKNEHMLLEKTGPTTYRVRHVLVDDDGDNDFAIDGEVDTTGVKKAGDPLVAVTRIGS